MKPAARTGGGLFYGWTIVGAFFFLNLVGQASGSLNFGLFVLPMSEELGLSRQLIGWAQTMRLWASGLGGVILGRWLDRYGPRGPMLVAIVVAVGGLLLLAGAQSAGALFGVMLALGASGWTTPGGGALIATVPVAKWFVRMRGRATGIVQIGLGIGGVVFLPLTQVLINHYGWRMTWVVLALDLGRDPAAGAPAAAPAERPGVAPRRRRGGRPGGGAPGGSRPGGGRPGGSRPGGGRPGGSRPGGGRPGGGGPGGGGPGGGRPGGGRPGGSRPSGGGPCGSIRGAGRLYGGETPRRQTRRPPTPQRPTFRLRPRPERPPPPRRRCPGPSPPPPAPRPCGNSAPPSRYSPF